MVATQQNPIYTVYIISDGVKYNVTSALESLERSEADGQIAQRVTMQFTNIQVDGMWLSSILKAVNRVFVYADDGTTADEVFRGFLWERSYKTSISDQKLKVTAYDNLIYLQESEDSLYFSPKKSTESVFSSICNSWGINLHYSYDSITHAKLPLKGRLYDILTTDLLDKVKKEKGKKYVIISEKDTMHVKLAGANATCYQFLARENVTSASSGWTMEGVVTQVIVVGKTDDNGYAVIEQRWDSPNIKKYGTLRKIQTTNEDTPYWTARVEARLTLFEKGDPKWKYEIVAPDIPWIRKGDRVFVDAGDINKKYLIVTEITRSSDMKSSEMAMTLEDT